MGDDAGGGGGIPVGLRRNSLATLVPWEKARQVATDSARRRTRVAVMVAGYAELDWLREAFVPAAIDQLGARAAKVGGGKG